jgi:hypothetical protein
MQHFVIGSRANLNPLIFSDSHRTSTAMTDFIALVFKLTVV